MPRNPDSARPAVTRDDVARLAGVSNAVVSYVLNGTKPVSPATTAKVNAAVVKLGYRPNRAARALRLGSPEMLGVVVPDATNPFFTDLTHEVELAAEEHGLALLSANADDSPERERRLVEKFVSRGVDGILLSSCLPVPDTRALLAAGVPFVLLNQYDDIAGARAVGVDLFGGAKLGVEHLMSHGHRRIGLVSGETTGGIADARESGWRAAVEENALTAGPVVRAPYTMPGGYDAGRRLLQSGQLPPALFVGSDQLAIGLLLALHEADVRVPHDVAIVSFDGTAQGDFTWPPLTSVTQPVRAMARAAVGALVGSEDPAAERLFAPALVTRHSCGCPQ